MTVPFALRRLSLLSRGLRVDRDRPDLARLARVDDPETFCWEILPHAARSFAVSIALLPEPEAKAAAVAYLYARILDSYEDLHPDPREGRAALDLLAERLHSKPLADPPHLPSDLVRDDRDRAHLLLVENCGQVDRVFLDLRHDHRVEIAALIQRMARGMVWASNAFEAQGGVLLDTAQLRRYCHVVIGEPTQFVLKLVAGRPLARSGTNDALQVSELVQLANVTRDIERDLARGVAYHPVLKPYLGSRPGSEAVEAVHVARMDLVLVALDAAPAYLRLAGTIPLPAVSAERAASVAMFRFTEMHYQGQARLLGLTDASRDATKGGVIIAALAAAVRPRWGDRQLEEANQRMKTIAARIRQLREESKAAG